MPDITLKHMAEVAAKANARLRVSWNTQRGYHVEFVADDDSGAIGALDPDIDVAARAAIKHLATYTRPDGGVDWVPKGPSR